MKRRLLESFIVVLIVSSLLYGAVQTINTLPVSNSSFISTLQAFLAGESAARFQYKYGGYTLQGGIGSTSATLTHTISAYTGFPGGYYVYKAATSHTYTANTRTYVYADYDSARTLTFAGGAVTRSTHLVFVEMTAASDEPTTQAKMNRLMCVDTNGTSITAVTDLRSGGEIDVEAYGTLADALTHTFPHVLVLTKRELISDNTTSHANITLKPLRGSSIEIASAKKLTVNAVPEAGPYQIFSGSGRVVFAAGVSPINVAWFGNDLTKAYASATSQSVIEITEGYPTLITISETLTRDKTDVPIIGPPGKAALITPTAAFTPGESMIVEDFSTGYPERCHLRNLNLDGRVGGTGSAVAGNGIEIKHTFQQEYTDLVIQYMSGNGIYVNGTGSATIYLPKFETVRIEYCNRGIYFYKGANGDMTSCFNGKNMWLQHNTTRNIEFYSTGEAGSGTIIDFEDSYFTAADNCTGLVADNTNGYYYGQLTMNFRHSTFESAYKDIYATGYTQINLSNHSWALIFDVNDQIARVKIDSTSVSSWVNGFGNVHGYTLGKTTDGSVWGPPNQPQAKYSASPYTSDNYKVAYTGTIWTDVFGVPWFCSHGGDNATNQQWFPIGGKIQIPLDHSDFDSSTSFHAYYSQRSCILREIEVVTTEAWDNDTLSTASYLKMGFDGDNATWIDNDNTTGMGRPNLQLGKNVKATKNAASRLYDSTEFMAPCFPGCDETTQWNGGYSIGVYSPNGTWTAGHSYIIIHCDNVGELPWGH